MDWNALLSGLGRGATTLGTSMEDRRMLEAQQRRQAAQDAFKRLQDMNEMGASVLPEGQSDTDTFIEANRGIGEARTPTDLLSAGPTHDLDFATLPGLQGGTERIAIDPLKSREARAAERAMAQLLSRERAADERLESGKQADYKRQTDLANIQLGGRAQDRTQRGSLAKMARESAERIARENRASAMSGFVGTFDAPGVAGGPPTKMGFTRGGQTRSFGNTTGTATTQRANTVTAKHDEGIRKANIMERALQNALDQVEANPGAFGLRRKLGKTVNERLPWRDNAQDATSASAVELVMGPGRHELFGGALTPAELQRAELVFSNPSSPPDVIAAQIRSMQESVARHKSSFTSRSASPSGTGGSTWTDPKTGKVYQKGP